MRKIITCVMISALFFCCTQEEEPNDTTASVVWDGDNITFTKEDGADPTAASNQDRLTSNVWITRGNDGGQIYNIVLEADSDKENSPSGTEWARGTIDQINTLVFNDFRAAVTKPKEAVGDNLVLHLIEDDIYLSLKILSWSGNRNGGFSYERSTP